MEHNKLLLIFQVRDIETGETKGAQISSAAGGTRTNRNPSFRVFYLDPVTYDVLDSDVYRINMTSHLGDLGLLFAHINDTHVFLKCCTYVIYLCNKPILPQTLDLWSQNPLHRYTKSLN